jgi:hypothetical protein
MSALETPRSIMCHSGNALRYRHDLGNRGISIQYDDGLAAANGSQELA